MRRGRGGQRWMRDDKRARPDRSNKQQERGPMSEVTRISNGFHKGIGRRASRLSPRDARSEGGETPGPAPITVLAGGLVITPGRNREHELCRAHRAGYFGGRFFEDLIIDDVHTRRWIVDHLTQRHEHYIELMRRRSHAAPTPAEVTGIWQLLMSEAMELRELERAQS